MYTELAQLAIFNLGYMTVKVLVLFGLIPLFDWMVWPKMSFQNELLNGNIAVGLFLAGVLGSAFFSTSLR